MTTPPDSATQPSPHYCTHPGDTLSAAGCPRWPVCAQLDAPAARAFDALLQHMERTAEPEPDDEDEIPGIGRSLAALAGFAAGCVIFLVVCAILLPVFL
jgi:hypothetical protein